MKKGWLILAAILFLFASIFLVNGLWWLVYIYAPQVTPTLMPGYMAGYILGLLILPGGLYYLSYRAWKKAKQL